MTRRSARATPASVSVVRIHLIAIGRARVGPERALYEHYAARLSWPIELREIEPRGRMAPDQLKAREAELLLGAIPNESKIVALDERGAELTSEALAERIGVWRDDGTGEIAFVIGGADGLDQSLRKRADLVLSLGRVTWPHLLVRGLIAEQLYRAQQILAGHPYHRR